MGRTVWAMRRPKRTWEMAKTKVGTWKAFRTFRVTERPANIMAMPQKREPHFIILGRFRLTLRGMVEEDWVGKGKGGGELIGGNDFLRMRGSRRDGG